MSSVKITGNASGTGVFTIESPNSNTDRTLTLPDGAGEILTSPLTANLDLDGNELILDSDGDTSLTADTDDRIDIKLGGTDRVHFDSVGRLLMNKNSTEALGGLNAQVQIHGTSANESTLAIKRNSADDNPPYIVFAKSRGTSVGSATSVADGDGLGRIDFAAADGTDTASISASIRASIDGTPGGNDVPGELKFYTTADGSSGPTERLRIDNSGRILIADVPSFLFSGNPTLDGNIIEGFDTARHNNGSHYSNTTGRFTAPVTGLYLFYYSIWPAGTMDANNTYIVTYKNGGEFLGAHTAADRTSLTGTVAVDLAANDYIELRRSGGWSIQGSTPRNYFGGHLIG